jgi:hypothetical protein
VATRGQRDEHRFDDFFLPNHSLGYRTTQPHGGIGCLLEKGQIRRGGLQVSGGSHWSDVPCV